MSGPTKKDKRIQALADKTEDAYSSDRYTSWPGVARALLDAGYDEREAEAIMRSTYARHAADQHTGRGKAPARLLVEYVKDLDKTGLAKLVQATLPSLPSLTVESQPAIEDIQNAGMIVLGLMEDAENDQLEDLGRIEQLLKSAVAKLNR